MFRLEGASGTCGLNGATGSGEIRSRGGRSLRLDWRMWRSKQVLMHPGFIRLLLVFYIPGTIYGYIWYGDQLRETWNTRPLWQMVFVPDSPTASLWFALALIGYLVQKGGPLRDGPSDASARSVVRRVRSLVEALGVVTSIKYGVWACAVIWAGWAQGDAPRWEHGMLIVGHAAMAVCALLYARFFEFGTRALAVAALWTLLNDTVDYGFGVYPYLPAELEDDVAAVAAFTFALTGLSVLAAIRARRLPDPPVHGPQA